MDARSPLVTAHPSAGPGWDVAIRERAPRREVPLTVFVSTVASTSFRTDGASEGDDEQGATAR